MIWLQRFFFKSVNRSRGQGKVSNKIKMKTVSNVYLLGFAITLCIVIVSSTSASLSRGKPRATRGFKNAQLSTARGFGKRDGFYQSLESDLPDDRKGYYGDIYKEIPEAESFTIDWFVEELANNPRLARIIIRKFIDQNQDGELSIEELLRNVGY